MHHELPDATEDNLAYLVTTAGSASSGGGGGATVATCGTKQDINAETNDAGAASKACVIVVVDVNGLSNGPNRVEPQIKTGASGALSSLTGDRYYIYVGMDGATAGGKSGSVTGRIAGDVK